MRLSTFAVIAALAGAPLLHADDRKPVRYSGPGVSSTAEAIGGGFSVFMPIVGKVVGSTIFYTSLDVTNHAAQSVSVTFFFFNTDGTIQKSGTLTTLGPYGTFHKDDIFQYFVQTGVLTSGQIGNIFGTMIVTFDNASFTKGTEAAAVARVFNYTSGSSGPTIGLAYRGDVLETAGAHSLKSVLRNTTSSNSANGPVVYTNIGLQNKVIDDSGNTTTAPVTLELDFYDPSTGSLVKTVNVGPLGPGQSTILSNVWGLYALPGTLESVVLVVTSTAGTAQIGGWVSVLDGSTRDGSFFLMR